jgi:O-antigen/teichoic acid export membrane protein
MPVQSNALATKAVFLTSGQAAIFGLSFVRNVILARLLTKDDFGLAAAFTMTVMMLELAGKMAFGQQVVQAQDGDSDQFLGASHLFQFMAGTVSALLALVVSTPMARAFGVPGAGWAFALLGLIPLLRGLEQLDIARQQRHLRFRATVAVEVLPQLLITLAAWPLAAWLGDYRAVLFLMLLKFGLSVIVSHYLARRPYRWVWDAAVMRRILAFSWPLIVNGILMFGAKQGDQILIGSFLSLADLATYYICFSLAGVPWMISAQVTSALLLPVLAGVQNDEKAFRSNYATAIQFTALAGSLFLLPLIVAGEQIVTFLYGNRYAGAGPVMAMLAITSAHRFLRITPSVAAMAKADTVNQMYSNLARIVSIPLAALVILLGGTLVQVAACALVGELLAGVVAITRLHCRLKVPFHLSTVPVAFLEGVLVIAGILGHLLMRTLGLLPAVAVTLGAFAVVLISGYYVLSGPVACLLRAAILTVALRVGWQRPIATRTSLDRKAELHPW